MIDSRAPIRPDVENWRAVFRLPVLGRRLSHRRLCRFPLRLALSRGRAGNVWHRADGWTGRWQRGLLLASSRSESCPRSLHYALSAAFHFFHLHDTIPGLVIVDLTFMLPMAAIVSFSGIGCPP